MGYKETLEKIHSLCRFGSRPGLERINMLLEMLGNPQDELEFVHVAGTNGKGSTSQMISSVLRKSGYKTGLFISPYITDFTERIQIDNTPIVQDKLVEVAEYVFSFVEILNKDDIIITEFEFVMAVAFEYFKRENTDIVVLETGLGGRLDCTNVIEPPVCTVLTRIGLDHTDILGDTIEKITAEKCGIIKGGSRVVSSQQTAQAEAVIRRTCMECQVPLVFADESKFDHIERTLEGTAFEWNGLKLNITLIGEHQLQNASVALCTLNVLKERGFDKIDEVSITEGFAVAENPARFEVMSKSPVVILDGAHNEDGMKTFADTVRKFMGDRKGVLLMGMLKDKDSRNSVKLIEGMFDFVYTVTVDNPRTLTSCELAQICEGHFPNVSPIEDVAMAFDLALAKVLETDSHLCICGSLYLAGQLRQYIKEKLS